MPADRGASVDFYFDGRLVTGRPGQSVAIALWDAGMFCAIGVCQECVVMIDGVRTPSCATLVQPGLRILPVPDPPTGPGH